MPAWRRWGRRISFWVLIGAIGFLVVQMLQARPVEVDVAFHWGSAGRGLRQATIVYLRQGEEVRRIRFNYDHRPPPAEQVHSIKIQRGECDVQLDLRYDGPAPAIPGGRRQGNAIRLRRPLIVSGEGAVRVLVSDSD